MDLGFWVVAEATHAAAVEGVAQLETASARPRCAAIAPAAVRPQGERQPPSGHHATRLLHKRRPSGG